MSKEAVLAILERAVEDIDFFSKLVQDHSSTLEEYDLNKDERIAIITGDVHWVESYIGRKLDEQLMSRFFIPLLSQEKW